ncbi:MAG: hypothetical protein GYB33_13230 [Gammaproteobacteria bacterium]|nr:hypothetical protein [Gammaproteobacteria bacterium]
MSEYLTTGSSKSDCKFNIYSKYETGHRLDYIKFSESQLGGGRVYGVELLLTAKPLLFLMVEESFLLYFFVSICRALFGRKTVGLVFRAKECVQKNSLRLKLKYALMKILKNVNNIRCISIVPFFLCEGAEKICDDWIYDFQFWDKEFLEAMANSNEVSEARKLIYEKANGRKIVCAIGKQDKRKGFDQFVQLYLSSESIREKYLFVSGGEISGIDEKLVSNFEFCGGLLINRRVSDSELVALYEVADVIWVCYSVDYDQSSGILGRALQYSKAVIVRKGSIAERLSRHSGADVFCFDGQNEVGSACLLKEFSVMGDEQPRSRAMTSVFDGRLVMGRLLGVVGRL